MSINFKKSLTFKLAIWIGFILVVSLELFFYFENNSNKTMMINYMQEEAYRLSDIIKRSTYHDMLRARSDELQEVLETIGAQEDVRKVRIIERGFIKMSSYKDEVGSQVDKKTELCYNCHKIEWEKPINKVRYRFFETVDGESVLGFVNPIYNEKECHSCHGIEQDVLGVLDIILSMEKVNNLLKSNQIRSFIFIFLCFLIIALSIGILIYRFVNKPIKQVVYGIKRITSGDLDYRIYSCKDDEIGHFAKSFNKMTHDLKISQGRLIHAKEYINNILKSMIDSIIVVNPDGIIKVINQSTLRLLQYDKESDLVGQSIEKVFTGRPPFFQEPYFDKLITQGSIRNYNTLYKTKYGIKIPINLSVSIMNDKEGSFFTFVCVARDMREIQKLINDLKRAYRDLQSAQSQLIQSSRLASMGELAASLAHEINNPINTIINYAGLLEDELNSSKELSNYVKWILKEGQRIVNIVKNLLSFSRSDKQEPNIYSISDIMNTSIAFIKSYLVKDRIKIEVSYESNLHEIKAVSSQLEQVFINMFLNARDALNELPKDIDKLKLIKIKIKTIEKKGRPFVRILFIDNGIGIKNKSLDKIFDPFFTTKREGKGTGLGLSICYRIISDHNGVIKVINQKDSQTCFIIDLPSFLPVLEAKSISLNNKEN